MIGCCLFLNLGDPICWGYNGYFEQRLKMNQFGGEALEDVANTPTAALLV